MNKYQEAKEKARNEAIEWQLKLWKLNFEEQNYSWSDLAKWRNHFYNLGKRYGLLKEFKENGIL